MKNEFKVKVGDKEVALKTMNINAEIANEGNIVHAAAFTKALDNKMPLKIEMERILTSKGLLNLDDNLEKAKSLRKKLKDLEIELRRAVRNERRMTKEEGREIALQMKKLRVEMDSVGSDLTNLFSNTVESYADNERYEFYVYACTVDAYNGKRYWKTFEEYKADVESPVYAEARRHFLTHMMGVNRDELEKNYYENKWLIRMGFMNAKGQLINQKGQLVDEEGRLINEEGFYINEQGERLDIFGNRLDKEGNLLEVDAWEVSEK